MKKTMRNFAASLLVAGMASVPAVAQASAAPEGEAFLLEMLGQRGWEVTCRVTQDDGDAVNTRERGRGLNDNGRFLVADAVGGQCNYAVPENGELRLTLHVEHTRFECPFTITEAGFCRAYVNPGDTGSFVLRQRPAAAPAGS